MEEKNSNQKKTILAVVLLILLVIAVVGITYAAFTFTKKGNTENTIRTGKITMSYTEGENGITLENAYPMEDSVGKVLSDTDQMFDFTVNINLYGSHTPVSYEVTAEKDPNSTLADNDVRIYLEKSSDGTSYNAVSEPSGYVALGTVDEFGAQGTEMVLDRGNTTDTVTYNYRLRMWVGSSYKVSGEEKYFTLKVNVYGNDGVTVEVQGVKLDKSSVTLNLTESVQLNASTTPASPSDKTINWTSSNDFVATVTSDGLVEAKGIGDAVITATSSNGKSASATINVTSPCLSNTTTDSCVAGTPISYKVNDTTTENFYVLKDNGSTVTLISANHVVSGVAWNISGNNADGPMTILTALENVTNSWTNVNQMTYNGTTYGYNGCSSYTTCITNKYSLENRTARARLITLQEVNSLGCTTSNYSCPSWLHKNGNFDWTMSAYTEDSTRSWQIDGYIGALRVVAIDESISAIGARAVVEINK